MSRFRIECHQHIEVRDGEKSVEINPKLALFYLLNFYQFEIKLVWQVSGYFKIVPSFQVLCFDKIYFILCDSLLSVSPH